MFVAFDVLEDSARIWIYQSGRRFTEAEKSTISQTLSSFTQQWAAHGSQLKTSFTILYDQFIVLATDENYVEASGCSIDSSVHIMKAIDEQYNLDLFDRTRVAFLKSKEVLVINMNELSKRFTEGSWKEDTLTFNNLISTKGELETQWIVQANQTWLKRYLTKIVV